MIEVVVRMIETLVGEPIKWVDEIRYLGIYILSSRSLSYSLTAAKRSFNRAANVIIGRLGISVGNADVILQLIRSKCMPILLYGVEACSLKHFQLRSLDFVVIRVNNMLLTG